MNRSIVFMMDYRGDQLQIGGTSNYLKLLAPRVRDCGFEVRVAIPHSKRTEDVREFMEANNIQVDYIDISPQAGTVVSRLSTAYQYFSSIMPDVAHFILPWWNSCEYGILGAKLAGVGARIVTYQSFPETIDSNVFQGFYGLLRRYRHNYTCNSVHKAISVSEINKHRLVDNNFYLPGKIKVIRNMIEVDKFENVEHRIDFRREWSVDDNMSLIVVVGYLEEIKGHRYLLQALPNIVARHPNILVALVGDGELKKQFEDQVLETCVADKVLFAGWQQDVPSILNAADLLVLPSLSEGLPFVVPEAMAAGLPVVATNVGGIPEAVVEGKTGLLVKAASSLELEQAIISLLDNPSQMIEMGIAGNKRANAEFNVERMVRDTCDVYSTVLSNANTHPS
ncbi:MAG: hypothetical protein CL789_04605 [Chloroflexi bacterium]|nr:hypothetical protein [Chloroflexota bacterium]HCU79983.1 hypothetical protein [Chloroflexota bacterium]